MAKRKPLVILTRKLPNEIETRMKELFDAELNRDDHAMDRAQLEDAVKRADCLVPTVTDEIDKDLLAKAGPKLKLIASFSNGIDHIDFAAAKARGITVTNTPGVLTEDTADTTMALILAVPRRLLEGAELLAAGKWQGWRPTFMLGRRVWGKRLGIIGMGRIGTAVARRARGFGLSIHYHNRRRVPGDVEEELEATYWERPGDMLAHVDIVSINCPATPETRHLLNAGRIAQMKPTAIVVNTSRGEVIDEAALIAALRERRIAGAGLDVYQNEPNINPDFLKLDNVVLLPHMGSATIEGRCDMGDRVIINVRTFFDGHNPPDKVLEPSAASDSVYA
ncbi:MAG: D-glycerate dehydrogenase [Alphaproteobacteria bacterium]